MGLREVWQALQVGVQGASLEDRAGVLQAHLAILKDQAFAAPEFEEVLAILEEGVPHLSQEERALVRGTLVRSMKAADGTSERTRRPSQDYTSFAEFLLEEHWGQLLACSHDSKGLAAIISQFLFDYLGLLLPSETTFGSMTGLIALLQKTDSEFQIKSLLETTKKVWRNFKRRRAQKDLESNLLAALPARFENLPQASKDFYGEARPCPPSKRPFGLETLRSAACRVSLRKAKGVPEAVQMQMVARQAAAEATERLAFQLLRSHGEDHPPLKNFKLLSPSKGAPPLPLADKELSRVESGTGLPPSKRLRLQLPAPLSRPAEAEHADAVEEMMEIEGAPKAVVAGEERAGMQQFNAALAAERKGKKDKAKPAKSRADSEGDKMPSAKKKSASAKGKAKSVPKAKPSVSPAEAPKPGGKGGERPALRAQELPQKEGNVTFNAPVHGKVKAEFYSAKSYIRRWDADGKKWCMLIGSSSGQHERICRALIPFCKRGLDRAQLLQERDRLQELWQ